MDAETLKKGNALQAQIAGVTNELNQIQSLINFCDMSIKPDPGTLVDRYRGKFSGGVGEIRFPHMNVSSNNWLELTKLGTEDLVAFNFFLVILKAKRESRLRSLKIEFERLGKNGDTVVSAGDSGKPL